MEKNWGDTPSATLKLVCPVNLVNRLHDNNRKQVTGIVTSFLHCGYEWTSPVRVDLCTRGSGYGLT